MKLLSLLSAGLPLLFCQSLLAQAPAAPAAPAAADKPAAEKPAPDKPAAETTPASPAQPAADTPAPDATAPAPVLKGLEKLTDAQRSTMMTGMNEVQTYIRGVRNLEALEKLNELEEAVGGNHLIANLRGAVYTKMRDFAKARAQFQKAYDFAKGLDREAFHPRFNLAELDFVDATAATRKLAAKDAPAAEKEALVKLWAKARESYTGLLTDPGKPGNDSDTLINFKVLICNLQEKREAEAGAIMKTFDQYNADSPAYYFAEAAKCFAKDDKEGAQDWLNSAQKIYPREINEVFNDSFVELGWLETLQ